MFFSHGFFCLSSDDSVLSHLLVSQLPEQYLCSSLHSSLTVHRLFNLCFLLWLVSLFPLSPIFFLIAPVILLHS